MLSIVLSRCKGNHLSSSVPLDRRLVSDWSFYCVQAIQVQCWGFVRNNAKARFSSKPRNVNQERQKKYPSQRFQSQQDVELLSMTPCSQVWVLIKWIE